MDRGLGSGHVELWIDGTNRQRPTDRQTDRQTETERFPSYFVRAETVCGFVGGGRERLRAGVQSSQAMLCEIVTNGGCTIPRTSFAGVVKDRQSVSMSWVSTLHVAIMSLPPLMEVPTVKIWKKHHVQACNCNSNCA